MQNDFHIFLEGNRHLGVLYISLFSRHQQSGVELWKRQQVRYIEVQ